MDYKLTKQDICWIVIRCIGVLILIGLCLLGAHLGGSARERCSVTVDAELVSCNVEEYLYAPYHGGRVTTRYTTYGVYSFTVGETEISIPISRGDRSPFPETIKVKYNPDNPTEFFYDTTDIGILLGKDKWIYHNP